MWFALLILVVCETIKTILQCLSAEAFLSDLIPFPDCNMFFLCSDDLQDMFKHNADERGEAAVHGLLETTQLGVSSEARVEEEDL